MSLHTIEREKRRENAREWSRVLDSTAPAPSPVAGCGTWDGVIARAAALGHPVRGEFAGWLWRALSGPGLDEAKAATLYRACGYKPFAGYPLTRLGGGK